MMNCGILVPIAIWSSLLKKPSKDQSHQDLKSANLHLKIKVIMPLVNVPKPTLTQKLKRFFMIDLIKGLGLTLEVQHRRADRKDSVAGKGIYTEQYPKVRPDVAPRFHGAPRLNMDPETHDTLCIACNLCAIACPEDCIDVIAMDVEIIVAGKPRKKKFSTNLSSTLRVACSARCVRKPVRHLVSS